MRSVTVLHNQSIPDLSLQIYGNLSGCFLIARVNGLSISDNLAPGTLLLVPEIETTNIDIVDFYKRKEIKPANALAQNTLNPPNQLTGIGYMAIENDFIVQ